jgi:hypothetical protein
VEVQQKYEPKRLVAVPTAIAMLLASIYPPFHSSDNSSLGYFLLFSAPEYGSIDIGKLVVEYVLIAAIGVLAWLLYPWNAAIEKVTALRIPPTTIRIFKFIYVAAFLVALLACLAASKLVGLFALGLYGIAAVIYFSGKYAAPAPKQVLLVVIAIMGAQACWQILAGGGALMNAWTEIVELSDHQKSNAFIGVFLAIGYISATIWFFRSTTLRTTAFLFLYAALLLCLYVKNLQFDLLDQAARSAAFLQISLFTLVLLLLPVSYYEYSKEIQSLPILTADQPEAEKVRGSSSLPIKVVTAIVGLIVVAAIFWGVFSSRTFNSKPSTPSFSDYFSQSTTGNPDFTYDVVGARRAGLSDASIADYLANRIGSNIPSARAAGYSDTAILNYLATLPRTNPVQDQPSASTSGVGQRAQSADGLIHKFPAETRQTVIDRVMKDYAFAHQSPPSVDDNAKRETEALTKVYPNWRAIVGAVSSPEKADPNNAFRKWLGKQPDAYRKMVIDTHTASVLIAAIDKFQAAKAKATSPPPSAQ